MDFTDEQLKSIYRKMLYARSFGEKLSKLKAEARETVSIGQEASTIGATAALESDDYAITNHNAYIQAIGLDADVSTVIAEVLEKDTELFEGRIASETKVFNLLNVNGVAGSQFPIACGAAITQKIRKTEVAVLCFAEIDAVRTASFKESLKMASELRLPIVFLIENNMVSVTEENQIISDCTFAYEIPAIRIDGSDALEVYGITRLALNYAREGNGPILIESFTSSISEEEFTALQQYNDEWGEQDPILRITDYLIDNNIATEEELFDIARSSNDDVARAVHVAERKATPEKINLTEFLYH